MPDGNKEDTSPDGMQVDTLLDRATSSDGKQEDTSSPDGKQEDTLPDGKGKACHVQQGISCQWPFYRFNVFIILASLSQLLVTFNLLLGIYNPRTIFW